MLQSRTCTDTFFYPCGCLLFLDYFDKLEDVGVWLATTFFKQECQPSTRLLMHRPHLSSCSIGLELCIPNLLIAYEHLSSYYKLRSTSGYIKVWDDHNMGTDFIRVDLVRGIESFALANHTTCMCVRESC